MKPIVTRIKTAATPTPTPDGRQETTLADAAATAIAAQFDEPLSEIYRLALANGICPLRYLRNRSCVTTAQQLSLAQAAVAVIGAGGLGGHVITALARIGIGRLIIIDGDRFDETNLNRQVLATTETVDALKAEAASAFVAKANPGVAVTAHAVHLDAANAAQLLAGADVAVDALDNIPSRRILAETARSLNIPLVHGALAGFEGHVTTVQPADDALDALYGTDPESGDAPLPAEKRLGVPSVTPAVIGALQAMEVLKLICGIGTPLHRQMHHIDLYTGGTQAFQLSPPSAPQDD